MSGAARSVTRKRLACQPPYCRSVLPSSGWAEGPGRGHHPCHGRSSAALPGSRLDGTTRRDEEDRCPRLPQDRFRDRAAQGAPKTAATVRAHHDQVAPMCCLHDRLRRAAVPTVAWASIVSTPGRVRTSAARKRTRVAPGASLRSSTALGKAISASGEPSSGTRILSAFMTMLLSRSAALE